MPCNTRKLFISKTTFWLETANPIGKRQRPHQAQAITSIVQLSLLKSPLVSRGSVVPGNSLSGANTKPTPFCTEISCYHSTSITDLEFLARSVSALLHQQEEGRFPPHPVTSQANEKPPSPGTPAGLQLTGGESTPS